MTLEDFPCRIECLAQAGTMLLLRLSESLLKLAFLSSHAGHGGVEASAAPIPDPGLSGVNPYQLLQGIGHPCLALACAVKIVKIDLAYGQYRPPGGSHPAQP